MKTRADLRLESENDDATYGHLAHVLSERQVLALEGIEDILRRATTSPVPETKEAAPFAIVETGDEAVTIHGFDLTIRITRDATRIKERASDLVGAAESLVTTLNRQWGVGR